MSLTRDYANPAVTLRLLEAGAKVPKACPQTDASLLALATMDSSAEVMRQLIARGSPVDCSHGGQTALYWAAINGQNDKVALLLEHGADQRRIVNGRTILEMTQTTNPEARVRESFAKTRRVLEENLAVTDGKWQ